jgi:histone-lysine N-methyltransferase SETMAR
MFSKPFEQTSWRGMRTTEMNFLRASGRETKHGCIILNPKRREWHHTNSPKMKKFKVAPSTGKNMATIFCDLEGLLLVVIMKGGTTNNSEAYVNALKKLYSQMRHVRPYRRMEDVLFLHDDARPHVSLRTTETITELRWTMLPHPPYSHNLALSDYHLFG